MNPYDLPIGMQGRPRRTIATPQYNVSRESAVEDVIRRNRWRVNLYSKLKTFARYAHLLAPIVLFCLSVFVCRLSTMLGETDKSTRDVLYWVSICSAVGNCLLLVTSLLV
jgi:hypothetical protein